jgi:hypothetical protein
VIAVALIGASCGKHASDLATGVVAACADNTRADVFEQGLTKRGAHGQVQFKLLSASPAPPARGDNTWVLELDSTAGRPITGAMIVATPFMPDHGHGSPSMVHVSELSTPGQYQLAPLNMWMPGYWETSVAAAAGDVRDTATFKFCVLN